MTSCTASKEASVLSGDRLRISGGRFIANDDIKAFTNVFSELVVLVSAGLGLPAIIGDLAYIAAHFDLSKLQVPPIAKHIYD